jgi:hypothetical protein
MAIMHVTRDTKLSSDNLTHGRGIHCDVLTEALQVHCRGGTLGLSWFLRHWSSYKGYLTRVEWVGLVVTGGTWFQSWRVLTILAEVSSGLHNSVQATFWIVYWKEYQLYHTTPSFKYLPTQHLSLSSYFTGRYVTCVGHVIIRKIT